MPYSSYVEKMTDGSLIHRIWDDDLDSPPSQRSKKQNARTGISHTHKKPVKAVKREAPKPIPVEPPPLPEEPTPPLKPSNTEDAIELRRELDLSIIRGSVVYKENVALWKTIRNYADRIHYLEGKLEKIRLSQE